MKLRFNRRSLIRWKVYFDRSRMYIGYIQFFLIGVVFLKSYQDEPWGEMIFRYALITIPLGLLLFIVISMILGFLDSRLGFREEEMRNLSRSNPVMMEMLEQIKALNAKIDRLEKNEKQSA